MKALDRIELLVSVYPPDMREQLRTSLRLAYVQGIADGMDEVRKASDAIMKMMESSMPPKPGAS